MKRTTLSLFIVIGLAIVSMASPDALRNARLGLADIGIGATVPANPVNTRMQQLDERSRELDERERALQREEDRTALWIALAVIGGLVATNFILDWRRNRA